MAAFGAGWKPALLRSEPESEALRSDLVPPAGGRCGLAPAPYIWGDNPAQAHYFVLFALLPFFFVLIML
jgi:hypothetical protein